MQAIASAERSEATRANQALFAKALKRFEQARQTDPDLQRSAPEPGVIGTLQGEGLAAIQVLARACEAYAPRPALGERAWVLEASPAGPAVRHLPGFRTITYRTLWQRTAALAGGLARDPRIALRPGEVAGIYGFGSIDYVVADLACLHAGAVSAVLQVGLAGPDLQAIVHEGAFACILCALANLPDILALLPGCPSVRAVVVMELHDGAAAEAARLAQARARTERPLPTLAEVAGQGAEPPAPFLPAPGTDPLATLMYTSGSTGLPKGAMLTQGIWRSHWSVPAANPFTRFPSIGLSFYPLSHAMGRTAVLRTLVLGGVMHFTLESDLSTLFEDIRLVRPTVLTLVPRISEMIHQACRAELQRRLGAGPAGPEAQAAATTELRSAFLGGRLLGAVVGSAPTAPEVLAFLAGCFEIPVHEVYGSTEGGVVSIDGEICRPQVQAYKLVDAPELGYRLGDRPHPRGELLVKTRQAIPGFFHNGEATRALHDADGFLRTGDIVEELAPDRIAWLDRRNNVVKLAQGEYITLWRLESTFSGGSPLLDQVYLYANSQRAYPLAVVVPDPAAVAGRLRGQGLEPEPAAVRQLLRAEIGRVAAAAGLRPYEVPRDFLVEPGRWSRENGLLTGIGKPARPQLKRRYGERLEALYGELEARGQAGLANLGRGGDRAPLAEQVRLAAAAVLGVPDLDLAAGSFRDHGGDSISALALAGLLEQACGVPVPAALILDPGSPLQALVAGIEARLAADPEPPAGFAAVHGRAPAAILAEDLQLERFLGPAELDRARAVAAQPLAPVRTVLLTGANGFLGHILCLEWLERMAKAGGRVLALVRGADADAAAARLRAACRGGDPALERRFAALAPHLEVLAGDLAAPGLGLAPADLQRLAGEVDLIVHPGALVNHLFSYEQLFGPNVLGTAQLIRLALQTRRKRFDFVSTVGVLAGARGPGRVMERDGVGGLRAAWPLEGGYAHGYATSKWAGEVLLQRVHERFGTPVRVFRPGMILPDRRYRGQVNLPDLLIRLLASVVYTGLAPASFYAGGAGARAHLDGLPVDFVAAAMVALSSAFHGGHATFQVSNGNWDDGVSLDRLVDWVESAGYPVRRIADHAAWYAAFSASLQALPADWRQHSSLPILHQWAQPGPGGDPERIDTSRFRQEVRRRRPAGESVVPRLGEAYLHRVLADLRDLGVVPAPPGRQALDQPPSPATSSSPAARSR